MEVVLRVETGPHAGKHQAFTKRGSYLVGRSLNVPFSLSEDKLLSREHFRLELHPPLCDLVDLGSTNGTKVNGLRVDRSRLASGDIIAAGDSTIGVDLIESLDGIIPPLRCSGCGADVPPDLTMHRRYWICENCETQVSRFPKTHPDYFIEKQIGSGGMGEVYLARELSSNRPVAIKMMVPTGGASEKAKEYFRREMFVLKDLLMPDGKCHPAIVAFYDIFEVDGQFQLVMEYVPGKNALQWISDLKEPLPISSAARLGRLLLAALQCAHDKGYVHRDVKPSNLLVWGPVSKPKLKLSDFGLAKSFRENKGFLGLTRQGDVGGSVGFISPDHIRDFSNLKEPADIYSAGATLYYLLTLRYPYFDFDPYKTEAYTIIMENPAIPLRALRKDAPEGLERVLAKALEKDPRDRWRSAAEMSSALHPFISPPS